MPPTFTPERRTELVKQLTAALNIITLQDLRLIARNWGWTLRGTAKSDIVQQMLERMTSPAIMRAAFATLPALEQEALSWLSGLTLRGDPSTTLQAVMSAAGNHELGLAGAQALFAKIVERGLFIHNSYGGYQVPGLFNEWLPAVEAPALQYRGDPQPGPLFDDAMLCNRVRMLLQSVATDRPALNSQPPLPPADLQPPQRGAIPTLPRGGLLSENTLWQWGANSEDDISLARFLLDAVLNKGMLSSTTDGKTRRIEVNPRTLAQWDELSTAAQQAQLRSHWSNPTLHASVPNPSTSATWNELDMALLRIPLKSYTLYQTASWYTRDQLDGELIVFRSFLLQLVQQLREDTWYSLQRFATLVQNLRRDPLNAASGYGAWRWYAGQTALDAQKMDNATWLAIYGRLVEAWLSGPATWLGYVQVATADGKIVAFRRPCPAEQAASAPSEPLPADLLHVQPDGTLVLRNTWQTGNLRGLIRQVAVEVGRDRQATLYRLDTGAVRATLREGRDVTQITSAFAQAGAPLPADVCATLETWQARAGRYQLYDNLAVIEFADDLTLAELQAVVNLERAQVHPLSTRCLLILKPELAPALIEELRRKGYSPQVTA